MRYVTVPLPRTPDAKLAEAAFPHWYTVAAQQRNALEELARMAREARALGWRLIGDEPVAPRGWVPL